MRLRLSANIGRLVGFIYIILRIRLQNMIMAYDIITLNLGKFIIY